MSREVYVVEYQVRDNEWEIYDTEFNRKDAEIYLNLLIEEENTEHNGLTFRLVKYVPGVV